MKVAVCICTCRRPAMLDDLLTSIEQIEHAGHELLVVVIDNDPMSRTREVLSRHAELAITFDVEPKRSIAAARNRSVSYALESGAEIVAFLDDDQLVDRWWLAELADSFSRFEADAVAGAVVPAFDASVPEWLRAGGFYTRPRHETGSRACPSGIANFAITAATLARLPEPFGRHFKSGGEDTYFFARMLHACGEPYWCDEAVVFEVVPRERGATWILGRRFWGGRIYSEYLRLAQASRRRLALRAIISCARIAQGIVSLPFSLLHGRAAVVRSCGHICAGGGGLLGLGTVVE